MKYSFHRALHFDVALNVLMGEAESRVRNQVRDVRLVSGHQVVQAEYVPALFQHQFAEMRTQKTSAACYHRTQIRFLPNNESGNQPLLSSKKAAAGTDPRC